MSIQAVTAPDTRARPSGDRSEGTAPKIALSARNLWKVFGASRTAFRAAGGASLGAAELAARNWSAAVRDVSLDIVAGEVFAIMGLSGSGKSTLIRCLSRLVDSTEGAIRFHGRDLLTMPEPELIAVRRSKMGMVFQNFALLPNRSVLGNVAFPLEIQGVDRTAREARARAVIETVGLKGREDRFPAELSGGQQQRVGIARSLAVDPEFWFLDEPFSALDPLIRSDLQDEVLRLQRSLGKTVVFITHDLDEAIKVADRIAIMEAGRIVQVGTAEDLVLRPADPYVSRFTAKVAPAKVVRAATIARPDRPIPADAMPIPADAAVEVFAPDIIGRDRSFRVCGPDGKTLGLLDVEAALRILAGERAGTANVVKRHSGAE